MQVTTALEINALRVYQAEHSSDLADIVAMVRGADLARALRKTLSAMITIDVHARDVMHGLRDEGVNSPESFAWQRVIRRVHAMDSERVGR